MFNEVIEMISTFGFPVVCCLLLGWYVKYKDDKHSKDIQEINANHTKEMLSYKEDITKAINNNTLVMEKIYDTIIKKGE